MAHQTQDEGFHEIQLNGKQLVFLFMAATVVSVVIFLCGVLVGRGVRANQVASAEASAASTPGETSPQQPPSPPQPTPAGSDPTAAAPPPAPADDLTYFNRLEKTNAPAEKLKPAPAIRAHRREGAARAAGGGRAAARASRRTAASRAASCCGPRRRSAEARRRPLAPEPGGQGFAVQIAALNVRSEADAIAKRLSSKGYAAYVLSPADGTPSVYRVRVGKFPTRREAETIAARLQKEEQFKPWVTR